MQNVALEIQTARAAVQAAVRLCVRVQQTLVEHQTLTKEDRSPVTIADYGAQAVVSYYLQQAFPDLVLVGEESAELLKDPKNNALTKQVLQFVQEIIPDADRHSVIEWIDHGCGEPGERFWTLDPIDGTKGFIRGEQYAVALALVDQGEVQIGVLGCPNLPMDSCGIAPGKGTIFQAVRGEGATQSALGTEEQNTITVAQTADPTESQFCESVESGHSSHGRMKAIADKLNIEKASVRLDSQAKYAVVARGDAGAYLRLPTRADYEEKIWDHAAGSILVEEAGGRVSDIHGKPLDFTRGRTLQQNQGVMASNGLLHKPILEQL